MRGRGEPRGLGRLLRCRRQARTKQLAGAGERRWTDLAEEEAGRVERAREQLGAVRRLGPVLGLDRAVAPPAEVWQAIRLGLPDVLDEPAGFAKG